MSELMFPFDTPIKRLCLYQADTKKKINRSINPKSFNTKEEFDSYINELVESNKKRNARITAERKRNKHSEELDKITETIPKITLEQPEMIQKDISVLQSPLNLSLDQGTGSSICILGQSKSGKTSLMVNLYKKYFMNNKKMISTLFCDNPQLPIYKAKRLTVTWGFNEYHTKLIQSQQWLQKRTNNRYNFLNILDDICDKKNSVVLNKMILTYRNSLISTIIVLQYLYLISKANRCNINHFFIFKVGNAQIATEIINHLLKPYFQDLKINPHEMNLFFMNMTKDHSYIHLDNQKNRIYFIKGNN